MQRELHNDIAPISILMAAVNTTSATASTYVAVEDFKHFHFDIFIDAGTCTKIELVRATDSSGTGINVLRTYTVSLAADKRVSLSCDVGEIMSAIEGNSGTAYTHIALRITGGTDTDVWCIKYGANYQSDLAWDANYTLSNKD
jgi:hypothetical protein